MVILTQCDTMIPIIMVRTTCTLPIQGIPSIHSIRHSPLYHALALSPVRMVTKTLCSVHTILKTTLEATRKCSSRAPTKTLDISHHFTPLCYALSPIQITKTLCRLIYLTTSPPLPHHVLALSPIWMVTKTPYSVHAILKMTPDVTRKCISRIPTKTLDISHVHFTYAPFSDFLFTCSLGSLLIVLEAYLVLSFANVCTYSPAWFSLDVCILFPRKNP